MSVRVLRVSGMPFGTKVWIDDGPERYTLYIDEEHITEEGAVDLERALSLTSTMWERPDVVPPALRAITG